MVVTAELICAVVLAYARSGFSSYMAQFIMLVYHVFQDYEAFSEALEDDQLEVFLKLAKPSEKSDAEITLSGVSNPRFVMNMSKVHKFCRKDRFETNLKMKS